MFGLTGTKTRDDYYATVVLQDSSGLLLSLGIRNFVIFLCNN